MVLPLDRVEKRLLILWFALAFVVWNGVYDMRMHDTTRGYLLEASLAQAGLGRGVDIRQYMHRSLVDAIAFSTASEPAFSDSALGGYHSGYQRLIAMPQ